MKPPVLKKKKSISVIHRTKIIDYYSWVHQKNIIEVLINPSLLNNEVKEYLDKENIYTDYILNSEKKLRKKLFNEIKGKIKLADESLPFIDKKYSYWTKTTKNGNYAIKIRRCLKTNEKEVIWDGNKENKKYKSNYFGIGDLTISNNDKILGYSLDLKGSEYYDIYLRNIKTSKNLNDVIKNTTGSI